jgi:hypothetical protein
LAQSERPSLREFACFHRQIFHDLLLIVSGTRLPAGLVFFSSWIRDTRRCNNFTMKRVGIDTLRLVWAFALLTGISCSFAAGTACPQRQDLRRIMDVLERCGSDEACRAASRIHAAPSVADKSYAAREKKCTDETALLEPGERFVVIRDRKMCTSGKVHTLVIPRADLPGVERIAAVPGIWKFAWDQGMKTIPGERDIVLVINSRYSRGQDWLHVHVMEGDTAALEARGGARNESFGVRIAQIDSIDQVEDFAETLTRNGVASGEYSILVAGKKAAGTRGEKFLVLVERIAECNLNNTEKFYTN